MNNLPDLQAIITDLYQLIQRENTSHTKKLVAIKVRENS